MKFLEKDLEQIIYESSDDELGELDLWVRGKRFRQLRIGNYGIADMVTFQRPYLNTEPIEQRFSAPEVTVFEFKKDKINLGTFLQALRYIRGIQDYLETKNKDFLTGQSFFDWGEGLEHIGVKYRIVLIGKNIDVGNDYIYLTNFCNCEFFTYDYTLNGLSLKSHFDYSLINKGF